MVMADNQILAENKFYFTKFINKWQYNTNRGRWWTYKRLLLHIVSLLPSFLMWPFSDAQKWGQSLAVITIITIFAIALHAKEIFIVCPCRDENLCGAICPEAFIFQCISSGELLINMIQQEWLNNNQQQQLWINIELKETFVFSVSYLNFGFLLEHV